MMEGIQIERMLDEVSNKLRRSERPLSAHGNLLKQYAKNVDDIEKARLAAADVMAKAQEMLKPVTELDKQNKEIVDKLLGILDEYNDHLIYVEHKNDRVYGTYETIAAKKKSVPKWNDYIKELIDRATVLAEKAGQSAHLMRKEMEDLREKFKGVDPERKKFVYGQGKFKSEGFFGDIWSSIKNAIGRFRLLLSRVASTMSAIDVELDNIEAELSMM